VKVVTQLFYISTGARNARYTLRFVRSVEAGQGYENFDRYVCVLADNVETAIAKATDYFERFKARVGETACFKLEFCAYPDNETYSRRGKLSVRDTWNIEQIENGMLPFGKHAGMEIANAPEGYVLWLADQANKGEDQNEVMSTLSAIALGIALEKDYIAKREEKREILRQSSGHVGQVGERLTFTGVITGSFQKHNEYTNESYFITKILFNGNVLTYVGNKLAKVGETISFKATIKSHDEYQGLKSTKVNRPKVLAKV
jgi:uncharacterized protein (DUF3820 family)